MTLVRLLFYQADGGKSYRVMATYESGAVLDQSYPVPETDPMTFQLPATAAGDPSIIVTIDSRAVLDSRENKADE